MYGAQAAQLVEGAEIEVGLVFLLLLLRCLLVHVAAVCGDNYLLLLLLLDMLRIRSVLYVRLSIVDAQHRELRALFSCVCLKVLLPRVAATFGCCCLGLLLPQVAVASGCCCLWLLRLVLLIKSSLPLHVACNDF